MQLSIVTTLYNSSAHFMEFSRRIMQAAEKITTDYEIILVDDGSPDDSMVIAKTLQLKHPNIVIVELSRNFGHHRAAMTGLTYAKGDYIFLIDCDLEEAPEQLEAFWREIHNDKALDAVYGVQHKRKGKAFERVSGALFFKTLNFLSDIKITENICMIRLMSKRYVNSLLLHQEREMAIGGLFKLAGFNQKSMPIEKSSKGSTTYNIKRKLTLGVNFITSMTSKPLVYVFYLGLLVSLFSCGWIAYLLVKKLIFGVGVSGWASIMASIWFLGGGTIFCLGIIGMYLSKIFIETKNRPYAIVKQIHLANNCTNEITTLENNNEMEKTG